MLTLRLIRADGTEGIYEAYSIDTVLPPPGSDAKTSRSTAFMIFSSWDDKVPGCIHLENPGDALFVMNRYGATVAKYRHEHPSIADLEAA